jgi:hypothetical protein
MIVRRRMITLSRLFTAAVLSGICCSPSQAAVYHITATGSVTTVEGNGNGTGPVVGDTIAANFDFDDALATGPTIVPIGGGTYSIYDAPLAGFQLSIGAYRVSYSQLMGNLVYMDESFGSDGIVFSASGLPGGPYGSTFGNVQFQNRGPTTAINGSGIANGLPLDRFTPSFFAAFGDGTFAQRVFGSLSISSTSAVPEPATWAMMIFGMGMVGAALRRSRSKATVVLALPDPSA